MTLGLLVGRFGELVREKSAAAQNDDTPNDPFPADLARLRAAFAHHLIPLALLSRADGDYAAAEQDAILAHCLLLAARADMAVAAAEREALKAYIGEFRPALSQLDAALKRIESENAEHMAALIAAAQAVVDADGERRPEEARLLAELEDALKAL
jgi:hypothetical protein